MDVNDYNYQLTNFGNRLYTDKWLKSTSGEITVSMDRFYCFFIISMLDTPIKRAYRDITNIVENVGDTPIYVAASSVVITHVMRAYLLEEVIGLGNKKMRQSSYFVSFLLKIQIEQICANSITVVFEKEIHFLHWFFLVSKISLINTLEF